jgi:hypothetical protein
MGKKTDIATIMGQILKIMRNNFPISCSFSYGLIIKEL